MLDAARASARPPAFCFGGYVNAGNEGNTTACRAGRVLDIFSEHFFFSLLYAPPFTTSRLGPAPARIKIYADLRTDMSSLHNHAVNECEGANHAKKESEGKKRIYGNTYRARYPFETFVQPPRRPLTNRVLSSRAERRRDDFI